MDAPETGLTPQMTLVVRPCSPATGFNATPGTARAGWS